MKRFASLIVTTVIASFALGGVFAGTAHAKMCGTFTKKEASKIVGFKVVRTEEITEESTDTEGCEYLTNKRFKDVSSPLKLRITVQPLADDTAAALDELEADEDAETVPDLGDRAFYTSGNELVAVSGDRVFQAKVTNVRWRNNELDSLIKEPELAAMRQLIDDAG